MSDFDIELNEHHLDNALDALEDNDFKTAVGSLESALENLKAYIAEKDVDENPS